MLIPCINMTSLLVIVVYIYSTLCLYAIKTLKHKRLRLFKEFCSIAYEFSKATSILN